MTELNQSKADHNFPQLTKRNASHCYVSNFTHNLMVLIIFFIFDGLKIIGIKLRLSVLAEFAIAKGYFKERRPRP